MSSVKQNNLIKSLTALKEASENRNAKAVLDNFKNFKQESKEEAKILLIQSIKASSLMFSKESQEVIVKLQEELSKL